MVQQRLISISLHSGTCAIVPSIVIARSNPDLQPRRNICHKAVGAVIEGSSERADVLRMSVIALTFNDTDVATWNFGNLTVGTVIPTFGERLVRTNPSYDVTVVPVALVVWPHPWIVIRVKSPNKTFGTVVNKSAIDAVNCLSGTCGVLVVGLVITLILPHKCLPRRIREVTEVSTFNAAVRARVGASARARREGLCTRSGPELCPLPHFHLVGRLTLCKTPVVAIVDEFSERTLAVGISIAPPNGFCESLGRALVLADGPKRAIFFEAELEHNNNGNELSHRP